MSFGVCGNSAAAADRLACRRQAQRRFAAATETCLAQAEARDDVCEAIGQAPYDPAIEPSQFTAVITNPLFPLKPGSVWQYRSGKSVVTVTVTELTRKVAGVTCVVVHDVNRVGGAIEEDTFDYFAQRSDGSVWYFGEDTVSYDDGIASTAGSWRAGVGGARPGQVMAATPSLGKTNRLEFDLGNAEDMAQAIALNQRVKVPAGRFDNAFKTREYTPIEPDLVEFKYYVPGIGNVLVVNPRTGEREELVSFVPGS